ncbi:MAG: DEAD/DEAH box helicase [Clostridiales bacterium]|nr:DEAD/DEAH box helicase [Candidatus Blautia equi]
MRYDEAPLKTELQRAVRELGYEEMTPIQEKAIPVLLEGGDVIGQAQTGTGKTAAFGLPILQKIDADNKNLQAIVLCPTRELAMQAAQDMRSFSKYQEGIKVLPVYGGQDILRQIKGLKGVQVVIGTPGRVMDHMRRHTIKLEHVSTVVLDEADEMLDMGFREDMEVILGKIDHPHQTCLFSATMPQPILELANKYQQEPTLVKTTGQELTIDLVKQLYFPIRKEYKQEALLRLLAFYQFKRCIIFCNTKSMVDELSALLQRESYSAEGLHGDLAQNQRDSAMGRFKGGALDILIATDIAARGIDVDLVEAVINYDLPQETEYYVHRIGRTGRAGHEGISLTLCSSSELRRLHDIEQRCHTKMEERTIPSADKIKEHQVFSVLKKVMDVYQEGHSGQYIPTIRNFCEEMGISAETLAAAFLKQQLGEEMEDLEISLPPKEEKSGRDRRRRFDKNERRERHYHRDRDERSSRENRRESYKDKEDRKDRFPGKDRDMKKRRDAGKDRNTQGGKEERKEIRAKNKKQSREILKKAVEDIRMNGQPFIRKKKR